MIKAAFLFLQKKLNQYDFLKNILVLMSGSAVALLIPFLVSPILTRFFSPDDFGLWGTYSAVVALYAVLANGRYEMAILLPREDEDAFNLFSGSLIISIFVALLSFVLALLFGNYLSELLKIPELYKWLFLVPAAVLFLGIIQATNYWHNRKKCFKVLSAGKLVQSGSTASSNLLIGKLLYFPGGLIISTLIGQFLLAFYYIQRMPLRTLLPHIKRKRIKALLIEYREFPIKSGAGIFLNILKEQAPIFLLAFYFDKEIVGFYTLIIRLFGVPLTLVAGSIGQVYFQKANEQVQKGESLIPLFSKTTTHLFLLVLLPLIGIFFFGEQIFGIVFGEDWVEAGKILVIFSFYYAIRFIISAQSSLLIVFKKLGIELIFNSLALVLQLASLVIGGIFHDYNLSLILMAISGSIIYSLLGIYFWIFLRNKK